MPQARRRVVTGVNPEGKSFIVSDQKFGPGDLNVMNPQAEPDVCLAEMWRMPATRNLDDADLVAGQPIVFGPPVDGATVTIFELPSESRRNHSGRAERFAKIGAGHSFEGASERHPAMHRTKTIDVIVIISGRVKLIMDEGETLLGPSDIVIQRGSNHAWTNPYDEPCVFAAVLIDAKEGA